MADELKKIIENSLPDEPNVDFDSHQILLKCKQKKQNTQKFYKWTTISLSSFLLVIIGIISIVLLTNKAPNVVQNINESIDSLSSIENDKEKIIEVMKLEEKLQTLSDEAKRDIDIEKLQDETNKSVYNIINNSEWEEGLKDNVIENSIPNYSLNVIKLIINATNIKRIIINKDRGEKGTWISQNSQFYNDLLEKLDLPYVNLKQANTEGLFNDYTNYQSFEIMLDNDNYIRVGLYNNGYVEIKCLVYNDQGQYELRGSYVSLFKADYDLIDDFLSEENLKKYDTNISLVTINTSIYSVATNSKTGPVIKFNLEDATFNCFISSGSFDYYQKKDCIAISQGKYICWSPRYKDGNSLVNDFSKGYMDVVISRGGKNVGYILISMKALDDINYKIEVLDSNIFTSEDGNYQDLSVLDILEKTARNKENLAEYDTGIFEDIQADKIIENLNSRTINSFTGFHSFLSSFIFASSNKSLIDCLSDNIRALQLNEKLTDENKDEATTFGDKTITLQGDTFSLGLVLTNARNIYVMYYIKPDNSSSDNYCLLWQYKCIAPSNYDFFTNFTTMGVPSNYWWCKEKIVDSYLDCSLSEANQNQIVMKYINEKSNIRLYYEEGIQFSGSLRNYYGKYNGYYAVMIDGCGFSHYDVLHSELIDDVLINYSDSNNIILVGNNILSLKEGYEKGIISHDDLILISKLQNGQIIKLSELCSWYSANQDIKKVIVKENEDIFDPDSNIVINEYIDFEDINYYYNLVDFNLKQTTPSSSEPKFSTIYLFYFNDDTFKQITVYNGRYFNFGGIYYEIVPTE